MGFKSRTTTATADSPFAYLAQLPDDRRAEVQRLHDLIREVAPELEPTMAYGMLGYGTVQYKYASGREGDWFRIGVASRKHGISLHCCAANEQGYLAEQYRDRLPAANIGKGCVRFKRVDDLDDKVLRALIREAADGKWGM